MKKKFNEELNKILSRKKSNSVCFLTRDRYQDFINEVKSVKNKRYKDFNDYKMLANYDLLTVGDKEKLVKPKVLNSCIKFYVATDELFGVLHTMHLLLSHPDLNTMDVELKSKYCNVSREIIRLYISICETCNKRS